MLHTGTLRHASEADNHGGGEGWGSFFLQQNQTTSSRGRYKQRKLQSGLRRDASERFTATGPEKWFSISPPPPSSSCQTAAADTQFQHHLKSKILCREILCNCSFFLLLLPIYPHLMYVLPCIFKRESFSFVVFFTLDKWCNGTKRRCVQRSYQD